MIEINLSQDMSPKFKADAQTRYKLSAFNTTNATEIKLTNDERKRILAMFSPEKRIRTGIAVLVVAFFTFCIGVAFCAAISTLKSVIGIIICLLPGAFLLGVGIYTIVTAPNIEKSAVRAYELPIEKLKQKYMVSASRYDVNYCVNDLTSITFQEAAKYGLSDSYRSYKRYYLYFQLDGQWLENASPENYIPFRLGIKVGDKARFAVLECGNYCYIVMY